jgi:Ca-activated chloride channel family protein
MFEFHWLWAFTCLPLPFVAYWLLPTANFSESALKAPFFKQVSTISSSPTNRPNSSIWKLALLTLSWICLVIAIAKPQWQGEPISLPQSGRDLLVAVDFSGSMEIEDMVIDNQQLPRYLVVKYIVGEFLKKRKGDRVGLVLFGSNAYLYAPLTFDTSTVDKLLQDAPLKIAGKGTAIGDAIGLSVKRLQDRPEAQRTLILLTDGENTAGELDPREAADLAVRASVRIHTIGVGADEMTQDFGLFSSFSRTVNPSANLDESTLKYIAETTGGNFYRAKNPQELESIYSELDKIEVIEQNTSSFRPVQSLYYYPLTVSVFFLLILMTIQGFSGLLRRGYS